MSDKVTFEEVYEYIKPYLNIEIGGITYPLTENHHNEIIRIIKYHVDNGVNQYKEVFFVKNTFTLIELQSFLMDNNIPLDCKFTFSDYETYGTELCAHWVVYYKTPEEVYERIESALKNIIKLSTKKTKALIKKQNSI